MRHPEEHATTMMHKQAAKDLFIHQFNRGFSLIEVLVALVVLSIGLMGMAGLQQTGVRNNHNALLHSQASMLAYEIADFMRSNSKAVRFGRYNTDTAQTDNPPACADTAESSAINCNSSEMATFHLSIWSNHLSEHLPLGTGMVECLDNNTSDFNPCSIGSVVKISVSWVETDIGGAENMTFVTEVAL